MTAGAAAPAHRPAAAPLPHKPWDEILLAALLVLLAALLLLSPTRLMTGDEPRYIIYAASILRHGGFEMPLPEWSAIHAAVNGVPTNDLPLGPAGSVVMNPVYLPVLLSPLSLIDPVAAPRLAALAAGLLGLVFLHRLAHAAAGPMAGLGATAMAALSIPLLPYLHLFYMEAFVFGLVCLGWWRVQRAGQSARADLLTAAILAAIPIVHLRGSVVAAALYLLLLWPALRALDLRRLLPLALPGAIGLALLVALNLAVYGALTGPVTTARPPLPWAWTEVLPMQLFNVRHGLLAYAPVWILGLAGLAAGAWRGLPLCRQGLLLAVLAALTGVGINPGECWPARFWVLSVPMLALGFAVWLGSERGVVSRLATLILVALTLLNTAQFVADPNSLIENRQSTVSYQHLFDAGLPFHFGLLLPVELDDPAQRAVVRNFLLVFGALFALGVGATLRPGWRWTLPMVVLLLAGLDISRVRAMPAEAYTVRLAEGAVRVDLATPGRVAELQIGRPWETWVTDQPGRIDLALTRPDGSTLRQTVPANQVLSLRCLGPVSSLTLTSPTGLDLPSQAAFRLRLYRTAAWLSRKVRADRMLCG